MSEQKRLYMLREVALWADTDSFYDRAEQLGEAAATALTERKRAQITGLEGVANSALKTTDVFDFIKIRSARHKEWREGDWGPDLLAYVRDDLRGHRETICQKLGLESAGSDGIAVHLLLIQEFVRQLAAHYEYTCRLTPSEERS